MPRQTRNAEMPGRKWPEVYKKSFEQVKDKRNGSRIDIGVLEGSCSDVLIYTPADLEGEILALWGSYTDYALSGMPSEVDTDLCLSWNNATYQYFKALQFHRIEALTSSYLDALLADLNRFATCLGVPEPLKASH